MNSICMLFPSSFPPFCGASFISEYTFAQKLIKEDWNVSWVCVDPNKEDSIIDNINMYYIPKNSTEFFSEKIKYLSRKKEIEIYYTREFISALGVPQESKLIYLAQDFESYLNVTLFDIFFPKKYTIYDINVSYFQLSDKWPFTKKIRQGVERNLTKYYLFREIEKCKKNIFNALKKADFIIALSDTLKEIIINSGINSNKIKTIREGADIKFFNNHKYKNEIVKKYGITNDQINILYHGSIIKSKGVEYLIKSIPYITKKYNEIKILIIGDGPYLAYLKQLSNKLDVDNYIIYLNSIDYKYIPSILNLADICVIPSANEPRHMALSSLKLYEAMAAGKPIIASNQPGKIEVFKLKKIGILCEPENERDLADAILKLIFNPKIRKTYSKNSAELGRVLNRENFDIEKIEILKSLIT